MVAALGGILGGKATSALGVLSSSGGGGGAGGGLGDFPGKGLINNVIGQGITFGFNKAAASKSWDKYKDSLTRGPTYMMQGLRDAGINPLLAVNQLGNISGGAKAGAVAPPAQPSSGAANSLVRGQNELLRAQRLQTEAMTGKATAEAEAAYGQARMNMARANQEEMRLRYYLSPDGFDTFIQGLINESLPNTWSGAAIKGGWALGPEVKKLWNMIKGLAKQPPKGGQGSATHPGGIWIDQDEGSGY